MSLVIPGFEIRAQGGRYWWEPGLVLRKPLGLWQDVGPDSDGLPAMLATFLHEVGVTEDAIDEVFDPAHDHASASWMVRPGLELLYTEDSGGPGRPLIAVVHLIAESVDMTSDLAELAHQVIAAAGGVWMRAELLSASNTRETLRRLRCARVPYDAALLRAVRPALNDPDRGVRHDAFDTLAQALPGRPDEPFWSLILGMLHHEDLDLRQRALDLMDHLFDDLPPEVLSVLEDMAHHPDLDVRLAARRVGLSSEERLLHSIMGTEPPSPSSRHAPGAP